ncbi:histidinol-phosphate transaminase [Legionella fallonii]|uniref:Histidinol-phosphate aminotransferase n=1 Tax=Legionella fallonii LLAP-10 TaxID=1212491 RepID=A0A098G3K8_9GAMM|nr:histidinol-phosphate transaminase [Legionella fallonii]CEG56584.1 Histidinol-phosphate aminotransferase 1 [Legionella fallonii LLAP-10]
MSILNLIRPELLNSPNYVPGGNNAQYRLHANELPWSPIETKPIDINFYPAIALQEEVQEQLAARYQVRSDQLVLTRGSDDGIDLVTRLFLTAGQDAFMQFPPTFPMYAFYVRLQQGELIQCLLDPANNFNLSLENINNSWKPNCKIIMFCSPNNPTANLIDLDLVATVCERYKNQSLVVVDEAYIEFANAKSATTLINQFENLVVLRTMSKASGLAGLRLGSIIAQSHVVQAFKKIIAPFTLSSVVIELARNALMRDDWFSDVIKTIQTSREWLISELQKSRFIEKVYPTEANFILIRTSYTKELTALLAHEGIAIRDFPADSPLHDHLRITVGSEMQNQLLIATLSSFLSENRGKTKGNINNY